MEWDLPNSMKIAKRPSFRPKQNIFYLIHCTYFHALSYRKRDWPEQLIWHEMESIIRNTFWSIFHFGDGDSYLFSMHLYIMILSASWRWFGAGKGGGTSEGGAAWAAASFLWAACCCCWFLTGGLGGPGLSVSSSDWTEVGVRGVRLSEPVDCFFCCCCCWRKYWMLT